MRQAVISNHCRTVVSVHVSVQAEATINHVSQLLWWLEGDSVYWGCKSAIRSWGSESINWRA